jgi:hypothetical protein
MTVHRWCAVGINGVRLQSVRIGGMRYTTLAWIEQFCREVSDQSGSYHKPENASTRSKTEEVVPCA